MAIRVLIVDDSAFMRRAISQMLSSAPDIEILGAARNGREGVEMVQRLSPDVVTMDIEMPEMDGLTALQRIMRDHPTQVLMFSSLTTQGSHAAMRALALGAGDVLAKEFSQISLNVMSAEEELISRVRALGLSRKHRRRVTASTPPPHASLPLLRQSQFDVICIGSSTGGPPVLETILTGVPETMHTPIVVAQHMPEMFTASLAERLAQVCRVRVAYISDGMPLERRTIYIAPGGKHTHVRKVGLGRYVLAANAEPASAIYRPSVDALFLSAGNAMNARAMGIVLTGIGADGLVGARVIRQAGGVLIAQSEETCVVYGMPKAVTENGLVAASLAPAEIAALLRNMATTGVALPAPASPSFKPATTQS